MEARSNNCEVQVEKCETSTSSATAVHEPLRKASAAVGCNTDYKILGQDLVTAISSLDSLIDQVVPITGLVKISIPCQFWRELMDRFELKTDRSVEFDGEHLVIKAMCRYDKCDVQGRLSTVIGRWVDTFGGWSGGEASVSGINSDGKSTIFKPDIMWTRKIYEFDQCHDTRSNFMPGLWVEIAYNAGEDKKNAIRKINDFLPAKETMFVAVMLVDVSKMSPEEVDQMIAYHGRFEPEDAHARSQRDEPHLAHEPYVAVWEANTMQPSYYIARPGNYIELRPPGIDDIANEEDETKRQANPLPFRFSMDPLIKCIKKKKM